MFSVLDRFSASGRRKHETVHDLHSRVPKPSSAHPAPAQEYYYIDRERMSLGPGSRTCTIPCPIPYPRVENLTRLCAALWFSSRVLVRHGGWCDRPPGGIAKCISFPISLFFHYFLIIGLNLYMQIVSHLSSFTAVSHCMIIICSFVKYSRSFLSQGHSIEILFALSHFFP